MGERPRKSPTQVDGPYLASGRQESIQFPITELPTARVRSVFLHPGRDYILDNGRIMSDSAKGQAGPLRKNLAYAPQERSSFVGEFGDLDIEDNCVRYLEALLFSRLLPGDDGETERTQIRPFQAATSNHE